jgi:tetraacyldisaccharide 4'-kinase
MLLQMQKLGDEPFQFSRSSKNIKWPLMQIEWDSAIAFTNAKARVILLDDAYQHRKVKAGFIFYSLLMELYSDDFMLPTGNLRESRSGAKGLILLL